MAVDLAHLETIGTPVMPHAPRARRTGYARFALAAAGAMLLAAAAGGVRAQNSIEEPTTVQPFELSELSDVSPELPLPEAPAPAVDEPVRRSTAPEAAVPADPPASNPGGRTSVVAGNGTEETETASGGAHVNNDATVQSDTGAFSDDAPPESDGQNPGP